MLQITDILWGAGYFSRLTKEKRYLWSQVWEELCQVWTIVHIGIFKGSGKWRIWGDTGILWGILGECPVWWSTRKETGLLSFLPVPTATMLGTPAPRQGWLHVIEALGRIETNVQAIKTGVNFLWNFWFMYNHKVLCIECHILNTVFTVFYLAILGEIGYTFFVYFIRGSGVWSMPENI